MFFGGLAVHTASAMSGRAPCSMAVLAAGLLCLMLLPFYPLALLFWKLDDLGAACDLAAEPPALQSLNSAKY